MKIKKSDIISKKQLHQLSNMPKNKSELFKNRDPYQQIILLLRKNLSSRDFSVLEVQKKVYQQKIQWMNANFALQKPIIKVAKNGEKSLFNILIILQMMLFKRKRELYWIISINIGCLLWIATIGCLLKCKKWLTIWKRSVIKLTYSLQISRNKI